MALAIFLQMLVFHIHYVSPRHRLDLSQIGQRHAAYTPMMEAVSMYKLQVLLTRVALPAYPTI